MADPQCPDPQCPGGRNACRSAAPGKIVTRAGRAPATVAFAAMHTGAPEGHAVVLDVAQLQALLSKTFNLGLDVGRGKEPLALVRLRLAKALVGVAEANALAAESIAIERGVSTEQIAQAEALALHAAAYNGMPDPVFHLTVRAMAIITGLAAIEPDPRAPKNDVLVDAALQAAPGLQQLLPIPPRLHHRHQRRAAGSGHRTAPQRASRAGQGRRRRVRVARARQDHRRVGPHRRTRPQLTGHR